MFDGLTEPLIRDPSFKEDAVRELIVLPILRRLGFAVAGRQRVVRSKPLHHPFIYVGTRKCPVTLIPDYTLIYDDKPILVLDAKGPTVDVMRTECIQQAYSYAIHPEIKSDHFSLCNGLWLSLFHVDNSKPLLHMPFKDFEAKWAEVENFLGARFLRNPYLRRFKPDFGMALKRFGVCERTKIIMTEVALNTFARISPDLMTVSVNCDFAERTHCTSFDFHPDLLPRMLARLPSELSEQFTRALNRAPFHACADMAIEIDLAAHIGEEVRVEHEVFAPLVIDEVFACQFNPVPDYELSNDIPSHVFRLSQAYRVER